MTERVAIVGSRSGADLSAVRALVRSLPEGTVIVSGGAAGVDSTCAMYARQIGLSVIEFKPDYHKHGHAAPLVRNCEIAAACDRLVAFWNGQSTGTMHAVREARKLGKPVEVYGPNGELIGGRP